MSTLKSYIERIENLEEEKKGISDDIADIYKEAKGTGFDTAIMKAVVKRRKMSDAERIAADDLLATYEANMHEQFDLPLDQRRGNVRQGEIATGSKSARATIRDFAKSVDKVTTDDDGKTTFHLKTPETVN
jgi:uncharacterized protein (UPF0335 family)